MNKSEIRCSGRWTHSINGGAAEVWYCKREKNIYIPIYQQNTVLIINGPLSLFHFLLLSERHILMDDVFFWTTLHFDIVFVSLSLSFFPSALHLFAATFLRLQCVEWCECGVCSLLHLILSNQRRLFFFFKLKMPLSPCHAPINMLRACVLLHLFSKPLQNILKVHIHFGEAMA